MGNAHVRRLRHYDVEFLIKIQDREGYYWKTLGRIELNDSCTSARLPLAAKAFRHAPQELRAATKLRFKELR